MDDEYDGPLADMPLQAELLYEVHSQISNEDVRNQLEQLQTVINQRRAEAREAEELANNRRDLLTRTLIEAQVVLDRINSCMQKNENRAKDPIEAPDAIKVEAEDAGDTIKVEAKDTDGMCVDEDVIVDVDDEDEISHKSRRPFTPRVNDVIYYFKKGHQEFLNVVKKRRYYKITLKDTPWARRTIDNQEFVKVISITNTQLENGMKLCELQLERLDISGQLTGDGFEIRYLEIPGVSNFLVPKQVFDEGLQTIWIDGNRFKCQASDDNWYNGRVIFVIRGMHDENVEFSEFFNNIWVEWDDDKKVELLSQWELKPITAESDADLVLMHGFDVMELQNCQEGSKQKAIVIKEKSPCKRQSIDDDPKSDKDQFPNKMQKPNDTDINEAGPSGIQKTFPIRFGNAYFHQSKSSDDEDDEMPVVRKKNKSPKKNCIKDDDEDDDDDEEDDEDDNDKDKDNDKTDKGNGDDDDSSGSSVNYADYDFDDDFDEDYGGNDTDDAGFQYSGYESSFIDDSVKEDDSSSEESEQEPPKCREKKTKAPKAKKKETPNRKPSTRRPLPDFTPANVVRSIRPGESFINITGRVMKVARQTFNKRGKVLNLLELLVECADGVTIIVKAWNEQAIRYGKKIKDNQIIKLVAAVATEPYRMGSHGMHYELKIIDSTDVYIIVRTTGAERKLR